MTLRPITPDDWRAFDDIRREMLSGEPGAFGATPEDWAAKSEAEIRAWIGGCSLVGVMEGARIVACALILRAEGGGHRGRLHAVYVRPEARGHGHMATILNQLIADARAEGLLQLDLVVARWNAPAIAAYRRAGFAFVNRTDGASADSLSMVLTLDRA